MFKTIGNEHLKHQLPCTWYFYLLISNLASLNSFSMTSLSALIVSTSSIILRSFCTTPLLSEACAPPPEGRAFSISPWKQQMDVKCSINQKDDKSLWNSLPTLAHTYKHKKNWNTFLLKEITPEKLFLFPVYINASSPCIKQQLRFPDKCKCPYWQYTCTWEVTIMSLQPLSRQM